MSKIIDAEGNKIVEDVFYCNLTYEDKTNIDDPVILEGTDESVQPIYELYAESLADFDKHMDSLPTKVDEQDEAVWLAEETLGRLKEEQYLRTFEYRKEQFFAALVKALKDDQWESKLHEPAEALAEYLYNCLTHFIKIDDITDSTND